MLIATSCFDGIEREKSSAVILRTIICFFSTFIVFILLFVGIFLISYYDLNIDLLLSIFLIAPVIYLLKKKFGAKSSNPSETLDCVPETKNETTDGTDISKKNILRKLWSKICEGHSIYCEWYSENTNTLSFTGSLTLACFAQGFPILIYLLLMGRTSSFHSAESELGQFCRSLVLVDLIIQMTGAYVVLSWRLPKILAKHKIYSSLIALLSPLLVTLASNASPIIWARVADLTKIGNYRASEVTLNEEGCNVIAELGKEICGGKVGNTYKICGAHVMSSLGTETYLKISFPENNVPVGTDNNKNFPKKSEKYIKESSKPVLGYPMLRDVFLPSKDILGIKLDENARYFDVKSINESMKDVNSICSKPATPEKTIFITFKEKQLFQFDKFDLLPTGQETLKKTASDIANKKYKKLKIEVTGYSDQIGSPHHNMTLSELRAINVADFLKGEFVDFKIAAEIHSSGLGPTNPIKNESDCPREMKQSDRIQCLSDNRRVEIKFEEK